MGDDGGNESSYVADLPGLLITQESGDSETDHVVEGVQRLAEVSHRAHAHRV